MQSRAMQFVRDPQRFLKEAIRLDQEGCNGSFPPKTRGLH